MVAVNNSENKELIVSFEGNDYSFPRGSTVLVDEKLYEHLKEIYPLAFDFDVKVSKTEPAPKVKSEKTRSYIINDLSQQDMRTTKAGSQVSTFNGIEAETSGPDFYGAGLEEDSV